MSQVLRFPGSVKRDPAIEIWMRDHSGDLGALAQRWFEVMRARGDDVRELLHDGHPTACVGDAAFAYVNAFTAHVNVGFFRGAEIADPGGLLEGTGRFMRHVKLGPGRHVEAKTLVNLIETAYADMKRRVRVESRLEAVHPVLMSRNVAASIRFYERLGFSVTFQDRAVDPRYAGVARDGVELHLQWQDETQWAAPIDRPTYRFVVQDVDALYAELRGAGAIPERPPGQSPWRTPGDTPWGTREFHVLDPDGNGLQFYRNRARSRP